MFDLHLQSNYISLMNTSYYTFSLVAMPQVKILHLAFTRLNIFLPFIERKKYHLYILLNVKHIHWCYIIIKTQTIVMSVRTISNKLKYAIDQIIAIKYHR